MSERGYSFHVTTIGKIERKDRRATVGEAIALAACLNLTVEDLVEGQAELRALLAAHSRERQAVTEALSRYSTLLVQIAAAADRAGELDERTSTWVRESMLRQTPVELSAEATIMARAAASREGADTAGLYLSRLLEKVSRDAQHSNESASLG